MTPAPPLQKEYIITEEQIKIIRDNHHRLWGILEDVELNPYQSKQDKQYNFCEYLRMECTGNHDCCPKTYARCIAEIVCLNLLELCIPTEAQR